MAYTQATVEHPKAAGLERMVLKSSFLSQASYDSTQQALTLTFKTGYTTVYQEFSPGAWTAFKLAPSHGSYYSNVIKKQFSAVPTQEKLKVSDLERAKKQFNPGGRHSNFNKATTR